MTIVSQKNAEVIEHFGAKGMKWGVRKVKERREDSRKFKNASKLQSGEVLVAAYLGGPIGVIGYKVAKRGAAVRQFKNRKLPIEERRRAVNKIGLGKAVALTVLTGPVGLLTYSVVRGAATKQAERDFR